ncbi:MAG: MjaI family restriction endonuclease [Promethearchaeota archaeon]
MKDFFFNTRNATANEESKIIDGFINNVPIQIKPKTYEQMKSLPESIEIDIIYYEKKRNVLIFKIPDSLFQDKLKKNNEIRIFT